MTRIRTTPHTRISYKDKDKNKDKDKDEDSATYQDITEHNLFLFSSFWLTLCMTIRSRLSLVSSHWDSVSRRHNTFSRIWVSNRPKKACIMLHKQKK